jgi:hypothetical protein
MTSALAAGDDSGSKGGSSLWRGAAWRGVAWRERRHLYKKKGRPNGLWCGEMGAIPHEFL